MVFPHYSVLFRTIVDICAHTSNSRNHKQYASSLVWMNMRAVQLHKLFFAVSWLHNKAELCNLMDLQPNILQHFDCVVVPDCFFHYSTVSLASKDNYVKRRSWRLTEWEIKRVVVVFPLCNHTDDLLSCLACARPVYLCLVCDWLHFKLYSTFLVFCRVEVPVYIKCLPYNILPVTFIHFFPFCRCSRYYLLVLLYYFICTNSVYISC